MVFILSDLLGDGQEDLLVMGLYQPLFYEIAMSDQADLAHGCGTLEMADQLALFSGKVPGCQFGQDRDAVVELHHSAQGFEAAGFVIEMASFLAGFPELAQPDDLRAETMPLFQQPELVGIDVLSQHIGLFPGGVLPNFFRFGFAKPRSHVHPGP